MIVVADTSPLRYLILIEHTHVLSALYGSVVVPAVVVQELTQTRTPDLVRAWLADRPEWLQVRNSMRSPSTLRSVLGPGEREAIAIAEELSADVLLMDDRAGRREAEGRHLLVLGTLRVLADAAEHELADCPRRSTACDKRTFARRISSCRNFWRAMRNDEEPGDRPMAKDTITAQTRRVRDRIAKAHGYDVREIARTLQQEEAQSGRKVVTLPPKKLRARRAKAGEPK